MMSTACAGVDAILDRQRHRLRRRQPADRVEHVVGELHGMTGADRPDHGRDWGRPGSSTGQRRATASASPPIMIASVPWRAPIGPPETGASTKWDIAVEQLARDLPADHRVAGGHVRDQRAAGERVRHRLFAEEHVADMFRFGQAGEQDIAVLRQRRSTLRGGRAGVGERLHRGGIHIPDRERPGLEKPRRNRAAHVADADEADPFRCVVCHLRL